MVWHIFDMNILFPWSCTHFLLRRIVNLLIEAIYLAFVYLTFLTGKWHFMSIFLL